MNKKIIKTSKAKLKGFGKLPKKKLSKAKPEPLRPESVVSKNARIMEESNWVPNDEQDASIKIGNKNWKRKTIELEFKKWPERFSKEDLDKMLETKQPNILLVDMEETFKACLATAKRKNADYAGEDQIDPFKNFKNCVFLGVTVEQGILVRMMDKMSRVSNLLVQEAQVKDEAITDTLDDMINYAAILKSYIKNKNKIVGILPVK